MSALPPITAHSLEVQAAKTLVVLTVVAIGLRLLGKRETSQLNVYDLAMLMALGIRHKNSLLTQHLEDMRNYMPAPHRQFIRAQASVREFVLRACTGSGAAVARLRAPHGELDQVILADGSSIAADQAYCRL